MRSSINGFNAGLHIKDLETKLGLPQKDHQHLVSFKFSTQRRSMKSSNLILIRLKRKLIRTIVLD